MPQRTCDDCGKEKDVRGGNTCEKAHFICKDCYWKTAGFLSGPSKYCPLCEKPLR